MTFSLNDDCFYCSTQRHILISAQHKGSTISTHQCAIPFSQCTSVTLSLLTQVALLPRDHVIQQRQRTSQNIRKESLLAWIRTQSCKLSSQKGFPFPQYLLEEPTLLACASLLAISLAIPTSYQGTRPISQRHTTRYIIGELL